MAHPKRFELLTPRFAVLAIRERRGAGVKNPLSIKSIFATYLLPRKKFDFRDLQFPFWYADEYSREDSLPAPADRDMPRQSAARPDSPRQRDKI